MHIRKYPLSPIISVSMSPADVVSWDNCHRQLWYEQVLRVRVRYPPAERIFDVCVEDAVHAYLLARTLGRRPDPRELFVHRWREALTEHTPSYSLHQSAERFERTGIELMCRLPNAWERSGLSVAMNVHQEPIIQRALRAPFGRRGHIELELQGVAGLVVDSGEKGLAVLEVATVHSPHSARFARRSDRLTGAQWLVDANRHPGDPHLSRLGFWDFIHTRSGTDIAVPLFVDSRPVVELAEYRDKVWWMTEDILRYRFARTPRWQFNTPCVRCVFADHCLYQDATGLLFPSEPVIAVIA